MNYSDLIEHYGTEAAAAAAIDVPRQTVHRWQEQGRVPLEQQIKFEIVSEHKLRADIPEAIRAA